MTKPIIGSALKDCDKVQRYAHKDPRPDLPFQDPAFFTQGDVIWSAVTLICLATIIFITALAYG